MVTGRLPAPLLPCVLFILFMNLRECFEVYKLDGLQLKCDDRGIELTCFVDDNLSDKAYDEIRDALDELLLDEEFISDNYDYRTIQVNLDGDTFVFNVYETCEYTLTKEFLAPVPA